MEGKENLNIDDYTVHELMKLMDIEDLSLTDVIKQKAQSYVEKFNEENNHNMSNFFIQVQNKLLDSYEDQTVESWHKNEYLTTPHSDSQNDRITTRANKVQEFEGVLNREKLNIIQNKTVPFAQGELNPTLCNQLQKILNIDSTFRQHNVPSISGIPYMCNGIWNATHFTTDLSDTLKNVLEMQLHSVQIPYTWYNISEGSNCFMYGDILCTITAGNYTIQTIQIAINTMLQDKGIDLQLDIDKYPSTGKVSFTSIVIPNPIINCLIFFISTGFSTNASNSNAVKINNTLGWILGFREKRYDNVISSVMGEAVADLNGPKYLLLYLDDFNMNGTNNGIISMQDNETKLSLPGYYNEHTYNTDCNVSIEKSKFYTTETPRTLTKPQRYTIDNIIDNRKNDPEITNIKLLPPTPNNILGLIPIKKGDVEFGGMLVENATSLRFNKRTFFGPVDIEKLEIKLMDDKGNNLILNGSEWSFSVIITHLYQY